ESTLDHSLRGKPWLPDLYREILDRIRTIESPEFRYAVLAGDLYIVATWKSVALAMRDLADPGWKGFYLEMIRAAGEIAPGPARLAAYLGIAEQAFGDDEIHRELQGAPWLAAALLRTLNGALGALGEAYDELSNGDRKEATRHLAQSIRLLDSRIGAGPAGETRERVPDEVLRDAFERSSALTEETYVERFPFSDDERYSLIPRLAFLECLLREMEGRGAASLDALFEEAIRAILRVRASYQAELWRALIRVLSTAEITPEERSRLYGRILDSDLPAPVQQAALSSLVLALGRDDRIDEALELAGRLDAPDEEYERLWNLAMMQPEPDPRIQGRLRELAAALGRDVHGPEAAGSGAARSRDPRDYDFDVAISYSGADRGIAEQLVTSLRDKGLRVYFDRDFQEELWGRRLAPALRRIYGSRALYCILLLSETYPRSSWARQEYAVLRERADEEGEPHLIPVLLDREKKPDLEGLDQLAYIDFREIGLEGLSKMVVRRVLGAGR
ncbi:MAG: toll/interleukin-1 receptor domain-containing protein, partial [Acidobacteriota bacterium]